MRTSLSKILSANVIDSPYDEERFSLDWTKVKVGEVVHVIDTGAFYLVKDVMELDNENGYIRIGLSATGGTVTSVGLSMPTGFSVGSSPIIDNGVLTVTTTLSGIIKGNGSGFVVATPGADYLTSATAPVSIAGTANEITADNPIGTVTLSLPLSLVFTGKTVTGGLFVSGAFNGTIGATTPNTGVFSGLTSGDISITGAAGTNRQLLYTTSGTNRWRLRADATAEGGANVGSNFEIYAVSDNGLSNSRAMLITRSTAAVTFDNSVTAAGFIGPLTGAVGGITPNAGAFTTVTATGVAITGTLSATGAGSIASLSITGTPLGSASGGTGFASYSAGDMLYHNGTAFVKISGSVVGTPVLSISSAVPGWTSALALDSLTLTGALSVTGITNVAAGTVSLPGLIVTGDPDTGLYQIGANNLGIAIAGALALAISSGGIQVTGTTYSTKLAAASGSTISFYKSDGTTKLADLGDTGLIVALSSSNTAVIRTSRSLADGAGAGAGTITNAPAAGNPTKWIGISDNGTIRYVPAW